MVTTSRPPPKATQWYPLYHICTCTDSKITTWLWTVKHEYIIACMTGLFAVRKQFFCILNHQKIQLLKRKWRCWFWSKPGTWRETHKSYLGGKRGSSSLDTANDSASCCHNISNIHGGLIPGPASSWMSTNGHRSKHWCLYSDIVKLGRGPLWNWVSFQRWIIMPVDHSLCGLSEEMLIPNLLSSASWLSSSVAVYSGNAISFECNFAMNIH